MKYLYIYLFLFLGSNNIFCDGLSYNFKTVTISKNLYKNNCSDLVNSTSIKVFCKDSVEECCENFLNYVNFTTYNICYDFNINSVNYTCVKTPFNDNELKLVQALSFFGCLFLLISFLTIFIYIIICTINSCRKTTRKRRGYTLINSM